jgi:hypothetical protein
MSVPQPPYDPYRRPYGSPAAGPYPSPPYAPPVPPRRPRPLWPWIVGGAVVLIMVLIGGLATVGIIVAAVRDAPRERVGSTSAPVPAIPPQPLPSSQPGGQLQNVKVGDTLVWQRAGKVAEWTIVTTEQKTVADFDLRPRHGIFLLARLTVTQKEGFTFACDCTLQFVAPNGVAYDPNYNTFADHGRFPSQRISAGRKLDGWVTFDVPTTALTGGRIQWTPDLSDNGLRGYWRL